MSVQAMPKQSVSLMTAQKTSTKIRVGIGIAALALAGGIGW